MKPVVLLAGLLAVAPLALADPLDPLIAEYESFVAAGDPGEAAREAGLAPTSWGHVRKPDVAARAAKARALLDEIEAAETSRTVDAAILKRLLTEEISAETFDTARIPFTGDWGFQAAPVFAALRLRLEDEADAEAWVQGLNDVPRFFAENR